MYKVEHMHHYVKRSKLFLLKVLFGKENKYT